MPEPLRGQESIVVNAPPEAIYDLVADVSNMGRFSPETTRCDWIDTGGPSVGAKFKGHNKYKLMRWSNTCEVIAAERGKEFAFRRPGPDKSTTWRYTFDPVEDGTRITESWDQERVPPAIVRGTVGLMLRGRDLQQSARTTLQRIKAEAEK